MRAWASEPGHLSIAGATVVIVGPLVSVSLSCLFPEGFFRVLVGSGSGSLGFGHVANKHFQAS